MPFVELAPSGATPMWVALVVALSFFGVIFLLTWIGGAGILHPAIAIGTVIVVMVVGFALAIITSNADGAKNDSVEADRDAAIAEQVSELYGLNLESKFHDYPDTEPKQSAIFGDAIARPADGGDALTVTLVWDGDHFALFRDGAPIPTTTGSLEG